MLGSTYVETVIAAPAAFEQLLAQLPFQRLDARRDRGLRQLQRLRRAAEGVVHGDLYERLYLPEVQLHP